MKVALCAACAALVAGAAVAAASAAEMRPLPVNLAPFEPTGKARQEIEVLYWNYKSWAFAPDNEYLVWAELKAGDRSVLVSGEDKRIKIGGGNGVGGNATTGFGRIGAYAGKRIAQKSGERLLWAVRLLGPGEDETAVYKDAQDTVEVDREARKVVWRRTLKGKTYGYEVSAAGPGVVTVDYDAVLTPKPFAIAKDQEGVAVTVTEPRGTRKRGRIVIDLGESAAPRVRSLPPTEGVDFWSTDAMHVPQRPGRNLLMNPGFEQRMKGWCDPNANHQAKVNEMDRTCGVRSLLTVTNEAHSGRAALAVKFRNKQSEPFFSAPAPILAGRVYTVSCWMKCDDCTVDAALQLVPPDFYHTIMTYKDAPCANPGEHRMQPHTGWHRIARSFVSTGTGVVIGFRILPWKSEHATVLVDDVQLEAGDTATDYDPDPVEADLVTSDEWHFHRLGERLDAKLALSGRAELKGEVRVAVMNFYSEVLYKRTFPFALDAKGRGELPLGLDEKIAEPGMFFVQMRFKAGGKTWYDYARFETVKPHEGRHPLAKFFCIGPECWSRSGLAPERADRVKALGWGSTTHVALDASVGTKNAELMRRAGVRPVLHCVEMSRFHPDAFGWGKPSFNPFTNVCPEKVKMVYDAAYACGKACAEDDVWWALSNEEELSTVVIRRNRDYDTWAHYQKAAHDGLKKAFDERGLQLHYAPSHGVVGGSKDGGVKTLEGYITAGEKLGLKYDFFGIHQAWALDWSAIGSWSEREKNLDDLEEMLARHGLQDCTYMHPENFYMLAQHIPGWGSIDWCDNYQGSVPTHALGNREFFHAGLLARTFICDLKRYPRLAMNDPWMQRFVLDRQLTPSCWAHVANTFGHILPDPRFVGWAKPVDKVRGYVFRQGDHGVLAVWTTDNLVELGSKRGPVLEMDLPDDARFFDLMNVERRGNGRKVQISCIPLFVTAKDPAELLRALKTATCPEMAAEKARSFAAPQRRATVAKCGARGPAWAGVKEIRPGLKMAWNDEALFIRIEAKNCDVLRIGFDGIGDARTTAAKGLGPDDSVYDFNKGVIRRVKCVNTQFAHNTTQAASDEEVVRDFRRTFTPNAAGGGVWEIAVVPRFLTPTRLEPGSKAGFGFAAVQSGEEPDLGDPVDWTLLEL